MNIKHIKHALVIVLLACCSLAQAEIDAGDNQPLPDLRWSDGKTEHSLYAIDGKPKILHFWAAWCIPCREEMPEVIEWRKQHPDIEVLALSLDERIAQTEHFIKKFGLDMPPLLLHEQDSRALGVPVVPYTLFVSEDNRFVGSYLGVAPWGDPGYTEQVRELLLGE